MVIFFVYPDNDVKPVKQAINPAALSPEMAAKMLGLQVKIVQKHYRTKVSPCSGMQPAE